MLYFKQGVSRQRFPLFDFTDLILRTNGTEPAAPSAFRVLNYAAD